MNKSKQDGNNESGHRREHQHHKGDEEKQDEHEHHLDKMEGENHKLHHHEKKEGENHEHHNHEHHGEHNHGSHGGGGMGFMSMVKMTKDMPRATDDLPMERNKVGYGPFFPGLPGGLAFKFIMDGDTVVKTDAVRKMFSAKIHQSSDLKPEYLPEQLSQLNPLAPNTYRILGEELLKKSSGKDSVPDLRQVIGLEQERIISHLNWLSTFGALLGNRWIEKEAARHMQLFQKYKSSTVLKSFTRKILHFHYLKKKLQHVGKIPEALLHHVSGPVAKAAGINEDERSKLKIYENAGFNVISADENNAWGRLKIRLLEIEQSLGLLQNLGNKISYGNKLGKTITVQNSASAALEGPAGKTSAIFEENNGNPVRLEIKDPSSVLLTIAEEIAEEMELSEMLLTIVSLDINPFTVNGICIEYKNNEND